MSIAPPLERAGQFAGRRVVARDPEYWITVIAAVTMPIHAIPSVGGITLSLGDVVCLAFVMIAFPSIIGNVARPVVQMLVFWCLLCSTTTVVVMMNQYVDDQKFFVQLIKNVVSILYFMIFYTVFRRKPELMSVFVSTTVLVMAFFSVIAALNVFVLGNESRAAWPFRNSNAFAGYLIFGFTAALTPLIFLGLRLRNLLVPFIIMIGLLAAGSRGGLLSIGVGIVVWMMVQNFGGGAHRPKIGPLIALMIGIIAVAGVVNLIMPLLASGSETAANRAFTYDAYDEKDNLRLILWEKAWLDFLESPLFGIGLGQYGIGGFEEDVALSTHNTYLSYLAETGVIGFSFGVALLLGLYYKLVTSRISSPLRHLALAYVPAMATQAFFNNIDNFRIVWIGLAIAVCVANLEPSRQRAKNATPI